MSQVLVTGGAGYIGSHMCVELLNSGHDVVVLDNFANSSADSIAAVTRLTNRPVSFVEADLRDDIALSEIFRGHDISAVLHFGGLKAVGESVSEPVRYYDNNVNGTLSLLRAMETADVRTLVFSSSATVYGDPASVPITEDFPTGATNPYGQSKLMIEHVLRDLGAADDRWRLSLLRYFNPVGAHDSGDLGEDPKDVPNNLMPFIAQVAVGKRDRLSVFGDDYATRDGTGVRDYIHVTDLVKGHVAALNFLQNNSGVHTHNLGTGQGYSVLEMIKAFEKASGQNVPYDIVDRRPGDIAECYADPSRARTELNWQAEYDIERMCADVWRWQSRHPEGY